MTAVKRSNPQEGYHAELDMGVDGKVEIDLLRWKGNEELLVTHSGVDSDGKYHSLGLAFDFDMARIYLAFIADAVQALTAEREKPSAAPRFIPPPDPKKGGRS